MFSDKSQERPLPPLPSFHSSTQPESFILIHPLSQNSALPTSLAQSSSSMFTSSGSGTATATYTTLLSATDGTALSSATGFTKATMPIITRATSTYHRRHGGDGCPTITKTFEKVNGICYDGGNPDLCVHALWDGTETSTFTVGCRCPAHTQTKTTSECNTACFKKTKWLYSTLSEC